MKELGIILLLAGLVSCQSKQKNIPVWNISTIVSPAQANSEEPYLFTSTNGEVYLSWIEKKDTTSTLFFSQLINGKWGSPQQIASGGDWFVNWADYPLLSKNKDNYIAHYLAKSGQGTYAYDVVVVQSVNGIDWSEGKVLNEDGLEAEHGFVSILPYEEDFLLAWLDGRNTVKQTHAATHDHSASGAMTLRAAILDAKGNKKGEWELDQRICDCCQTGAANTKNGPVIIYRDRSENEIRDMAIVRWVDSHWTDPKIIYHDGWEIKGCPVNGPRVDAIDNTLAIVWFTAAGGVPKVKVAFSNDGGASFENPIEIATIEVIGRVDVVMKDKKSAFISWMEGMEIKMMMVDVNGNKSTVMRVASSSNARSSGFPQMTKSNSDLIFAWTNDSLKQVLTAKLNFNDIETAVN